MFGSVFKPYGLVWNIMDTVTDVLGLSLLWQALHPGRPPLPNNAPVMKPTPCDCTDSRLSGRRTASVAAGPLLVANAAVLGSVGEVLVLANDADRRIYYVCQNSVSFSG